MRNFVVAFGLLALGLSCSNDARRTGGRGAGTDTGGIGGLIIDDNDDGSGVPPLAGTITSDSGDTVTVSGQPVEVRFILTMDDGSAADPTWSVDNPRIGTIDDRGTLTLSGNVGGLIVVTATVGGRSTSFTLTVNVEIFDAGTVSEGDRTALLAGGSADATFKWLYPYDNTVFPRGLSAPQLQFLGTTANSTYLKITTAHFSYQGFASGTDPLRVTIPASIWDGVTHTAGAADPVRVEVTKLSNGAVTGPLTESWYIAQGSLRGIIYYSTYRSPLTGGVTASDGGGLIQIRPGHEAEVVQPIPKCSVCHSVSADGSMLALSRDNQADESGDWNPVDSSTFSLNADGSATPVTTTTEGRLFSMVGLTPDGSMALTSGIPPATYSPFVHHGVASTAGFASSLVNTTTGAPIAAPTLTSHVTYALTPSFSPDGAHVAFVNGDKATPGCTTSAAITSPDCRHVLTLLDVDLDASPPIFSNPRDLIDQKGGGKLVAYPSFLPDSQGIIYHEGDSFDSAGFNPDANAQSPALYAEIRLVDTATSTVKQLQALNGRSEAGDVYLPYGEAVEGRMNYEPNVLPIAVGGYYWVLFTSRRVYGNVIGPDGTVRTVSPPSNPIAPGAHDPWGDASAPSWRKKIWIAAIDIDHTGKADPSHPAFLLPGQELESANMRGFGALPPCKPDGQACESGSDCCNGFCRQSSDSGGDPVCVPPPEDSCSLTDEPCDPGVCCDPTNSCINHRCSVIIVR